MLFQDIPNFEINRGDFSAVDRGVEVRVILYEDPMKITEKHFIGERGSCIWGDQRDKISQNISDQYGAYPVNKFPKNRLKMGSQYGSSKAATGFNQALVYIKEDR